MYAVVNLFSPALLFLLCFANCQSARKKTALPESTGLFFGKRTPIVHRLAVSKRAAPNRVGNGLLFGKRVAPDTSSSLFVGRPGGYEPLTDVGIEAIKRRPSSTLFFGKRRPSSNLFFGKRQGVRPAILWGTETGEVSVLPVDYLDEDETESNATGEIGFVEVADSLIDVGSADARLEKRLARGGMSENALFFGKRGKKPAASKKNPLFFGRDTNDVEGLE